LGGGLLSRGVSKLKVNELGFVEVLFWMLFLANCPCCVGGMHTITFKDGMVWTVEVREISLQYKRIAFELITSEPPLGVTSVQHTIQCHTVTTTNQTYVNWSTDYSIDVTGPILEDSRFKKQDALNDLISAASS